MVVSLGLAIWQYRGFVIANIKRDFQSRYQHSVLGGVWAAIAPLATIFIYMVVFSQLMKARLPGVASDSAYGIYLCAGVLPWVMFSDTLSRASDLLIANGNLLKKLSFPRSCMYVALFANTFVSFLISFLVLLVVLFFFDALPGPRIFLMLPVLAVQLLLTLGIAFFVSITNVFFRDVGQAIGVVIQFWFWATPIVYPVSILPEQFQNWLWLNPMATIVSCYQSLLILGGDINWSGLAGVALFSCILLVFGARFYAKRIDEVVDEL